MEQDEFWRIIDTAKAGAASFEQRTEELRRLLQPSSDEQLLAFAHLFAGFREAADTEALLLVARELTEGFSDDGWMDFRTWLISAGSEVYFSAVQSPSSLLEMNLDSEDDFFFEEFVDGFLLLIEERELEW